MKLPIIKSLKSIMEGEIISFHVPGHKNGKIYRELGYTDWSNILTNIDSTEIEGTDNLFDAKECIKYSQDIANEAFKSKQTFFLVNGTTCGIQAALMSICNPEDEVIICRDAHKSTINACILGGIKPVYAKPKTHKEFGISLGVECEDIITLVDNNPKIKGAIITYPTYYGVTFDIKEIIDKLHERGKIVIIDQAHGSHLGLSERLPQNSIELGADIVVQSIHKTLPALTQASTIHVNGNLVDIERLKILLSILQSSSPSYILMSSLEVAVDIYINHGKALMDKLIKNVLRLKEFCKSLKNISIFECEAMDITKVFLITKELKKSGYEISKDMRKQHNIQVELSNEYGVLLITTIGNTDDDFDKLIKALKEMDNNIGNQELKEFNYNEINSKNIIDIRNAFFCDKIDMEIENAIGKISGEFVIPYPPGIPILAPGDLIEEKMINYIKEMKAIGMEVNGISDTELKRIKVLNIE